MPKTKSGPKADKNKDKPIHPYSRKAKQMGKQVQHYRKVESAKNMRVVRLELLAQKMIWFQEMIDDRESYSQEELIAAVMEYRNRFEEELEQINIVQKVGKRQTQSRQHASREAAIKITKEDERNQYESCGIEVPDIVDKECLEVLRNWGGELNLIQTIKLVKVSKHKGVSGHGPSKDKNIADIDTPQDINPDDDNDDESIDDKEDGDEEEEDL